MALSRFAVLLAALFVCSPVLAQSAPKSAPISAPASADGSAAESAGPITLVPSGSMPGAEDYLVREFERSVDAAFATGDFVGLSVAIVKGGRTQFIKSWGVVEQGGAPVTAATVFRIGSLSKGFASTLAALAMTEGRLSPDDPVTRFAPDFRLAGGAEKTLTLGHALSHQTGLPPNAYDNLLEDGLAVADIYPKYRGVKMICGVGKCYAYQNIAFDTINLAIASAYGEPYADAAARRLFGPLAMNRASIGEAGLTGAADWARPHVRDRVKGSDDRFGAWRAVTVKPNYYRVPAAGGVNASALDMAEWLKAQMGYAPAVLSKETLDLVHTPRVITPSETARMRSVSPRFRAAQYAFGWRLYNYEGAPVIAHAGTVEGYAAQIAWLPEQDVGVVILANARSRRLWRILPTFLDLELGLPREDWLDINSATGAAASALP